MFFHTVDRRIKKTISQLASWNFATMYCSRYIRADFKTSIKGGINVTSLTLHKYIYYLYIEMDSSPYNIFLLLS